MVDYDKYYITKNLFGEPYAELLEFFKKYKPKGKVIDVGCGQGRDAIALARIGYIVTGIDSSKVGIDQMIQISKIENLNITGWVRDVYSFDDFADYDIVILDSMFHFEKRDKEKEISLIRNIATRIKKNGLICFCVQNTGQKVNTLKESLKSTTIKFETLKDSSLIYKFKDEASGHTSETKYCMYIVKKKINTK